MTPAQKRLRELRDRQSKERGRMAELSLVDELSAEQRAELDTIEQGTPDLERQIRAAMVGLEAEEREAETRAADERDREMRERLELRGRASLTGYLRAALEGRQVDGAEAELRAAAGVSGIPLELWDVPQPTEQRQTDAASPAPGTVGVNLDRIRPAVFANSVAPRLGIEMPRVASGTYASATISTSLTAGAKAKGGAAEATAAGFTVTSVTPKRISARLSIQVEDVAAVGQANFESALKRKSVAGVERRIRRSGDQRRRHRAQPGGRLQPAHRPDRPDRRRRLRRLRGGTRRRRGRALVEHDQGRRDRGRAGNLCAGKQDLPDRDQLQGRNVRRRLRDGEHRGFWTNKRMPDAASTIQQAILYRKGRSMMGGAGAVRTAVCAHWNEISIDDIYSGSASGTRFFTMHVLLGDVILVQPDAYEQIAFKLA